MDTTKWKSVAIRKEIVELAAEIGAKTERPVSNVFAYAVKRLNEDLKEYETSEFNESPYLKNEKN
tara:strand:+ start:44 stop:238 length:195 start_codon:yes stop_codon:yes gene_type:complete